VNLFVNYLNEIGLDISFVVCKEQGDIILKKLCHNLNIEIFDYDTFEHLVLESKIPKVDYAFSWNFGRLISKKVINYFDGNIINFHPGPLPEYKGVFGINFAIYDQIDYWGATVHFVDEKFDNGNIIYCEKFKLDIEDDVNSIQEKTQNQLYYLAVKVINNIKNEIPLPIEKQDNYGKYISRKDFEQKKKICMNDKNQEIDKKIDAFFIHLMKEPMWRLMVSIIH
jgi:methionyl-tRNA formyltransferase